MNTVNTYYLLRISIFRISAYASNVRRNGFKIKCKTRNQLRWNKWSSQISKPKGAKNEKQLSAECSTANSYKLWRYSFFIGKQYKWAFPFVPWGVTNPESFLMRKRNFIGWFWRDIFMYKIQTGPHELYSQYSISSHPNTRMSYQHIAVYSFRTVRRPESSFYISTLRCIMYLPLSRININNINRASKRCYKIYLFIDVQR